MIIKLKYKTINLESSPFFIAEVGFNFNNNIQLAKEMIAAAKESFADAVKIQSFKAEKLLLQSEPAFEIIRQNELSYDNHFILKEYADSIKIDLFSSPFDCETLKFLVEKLKVKIIKIASGDMDYQQLIEKSAQTGLPIILSTGFSDYKEISKSVNFIKKINPNLIILHCISNYPLKPENANLNVIPVIKKKFNCVTGFSDHSLGCHLCAAAAALGAKVFEKHFTTDRKLNTIDNPISTEPEEFKRMVSEVNEIISALGSGKKNINELKIESAIKKCARRSVFAAADIKKNEIITENKIKIVRPFIKNALRPADVNKILNKKSRKSYNFNDPMIL
ncbi:N-acetylneuraminate synthase family protein [Candidatus Dependentiae bacterium]|nr:N-acetylneuraminate synthase family protein [Candidatus Dependentiae bacterium]